MKTFSEDDIHRSVKLSVWSGGEATNRRLDAAFKGIKPKDSGAFLCCGNCFPCHWLTRLICYVPVVFAQGV